MWPIRVYYEDTDAAGIVYYANYLKFMERARTEWLRQAGFELDNLRSYEQIVFVVTEAQLHFKKPARFNDQLVISAAIAAHKKASFVFVQQVMRGQTRELLCSGTIKIACLDPDSFRPKALPSTLVKEILVL